MAGHLHRLIRSLVLWVDLVGCRRIWPARVGWPVGLHLIDQALRQGAHAHGFDTDHWTLARIASVIKQLTGVAYHPGHVWKLLHNRLHYRLQRPARRAIERDERAIARWVAEDWP
jgi:Winged helix-turn helix